MDSTRDSTLRQRAEAVTDSAPAAAQLFHRAPVPLLGLDSAQRITQANAAAGELLETPCELLVGVPFAQLLVAGAQAQWAAFLERSTPTEFALQRNGGARIVARIRLTLLEGGAAVLALEAQGGARLETAPIPAMPPLSTEASPLRILLVEDEPIVRKSLGRQLKHLGLEVVAVGSGPEAMAAADSQIFDAVLSDLSMPGMDGVALAGRLREGHPALPIIIMSGNVPEDLQPQLLALNLGRLDKPFGEGELRVALEQLVPRASRR